MTTSSTKNNSGRRRGSGIGSRLSTPRFIAITAMNRAAIPGRVCACWPAACTIRIGPPISCAGIRPCTIFTTLMSDVCTHQAVCSAPLTDRLHRADTRPCSKPRSMPMRYALPIASPNMLFSGRSSGVTTNWIVPSPRCTSSVTACAAARADRLDSSSHVRDRLAVDPVTRSPACRPAFAAGMSLDHAADPAGPLGAPAARRCANTT